MLKLYSFTYGPFQENTYVLSNEHNDAIIIDPGMFFDEEKQQLKSFIEKEQLKLQKVILTHAHIDHVAGLKWIYDNYQLVPYLHENEEVILKNAKQSGIKYGLDFEAYDGELHFFSEKDILQLGEDSLQLLFVPGHSPGSIAFYSQKQNFVIAGDTLFKDSIGRTDLPFSNHGDLVRNIKEKLLTLPENTQIFPGHGGGTTIEHEKIANPFL